ncbi:hypothetical protein HK097_011287 [Rhizophlyctis rosea]|uniref:Gamma-soluble NSF attachment protein n=1 Tax=Rhizophlyctis rosea TaxID=64517 RepID=A0AAD5S8X8_9FUNG|nr:hypothetical protein HK097_011287 [Rhizophlyctis rosea]
MADSKVREGLDFMEAGRKAETKTSFFGKKKPDWDSAAFNYDEAAKSFRSGRAYDHCVEAFMKAAEAHKELGSLHMGGTALETAASIAVQQLNKADHGAALYKQSSDFFLASGSPDRAAECLEKAAKALQPTNIDKCLAFYIEACDMYEQEDRIRFGVDTFKRAIGLLLQNRRFDTAIQLSSRLADIFAKLNQSVNFHKQALATVVIALGSGDDVEASKRWEHFAGTLAFGGTQEGAIANNLIQAYEQADEQALAETQKAREIKLLDNEVARLALSLSVPTHRRPQPTPGSAIPPSQSVQDIQDQIEEEGFL